MPFLCNMDKMYFLSTCDTCRKIIGRLPAKAKLVFQDIRKEPITEAQLEEMRRLAGSYEALFSRKAQLYKERGLKDQTLSEDDYRNLILEHYTFLSRPVFVLGDAIYIGNAAKTIDAVVEVLSGDRG